MDGISEERIITEWERMNFWARGLTENTKFRVLHLSLRGGNVDMLLYIEFLLGCIALFYSLVLYMSVLVMYYLLRQI